LPNLTSMREGSRIGLSGARHQRIDRSKVVCIPGQTDLRLVSVFVWHYNRTCLERACPKELLKRNGSVYQSEVISDCSEAATCSKRAMVRRSVVPRERLWERPWKVR